MSGQPPTPSGSPTNADRRRTNPFRSSRIVPGAVDYFFSPKNETLVGPASVAEVMDALRQLKWRGAIVGAHGTGKSSLLAALLPALNDAGKMCALFELHDGQRKLDWAKVDEAAAKILVIDGYEQLSLWQKSKLRRFCERKELGLLVTAHAAQRGLPVVVSTQADDEVAAAVLEQLLQHEPELLPLASRLAKDLLPKHDGNLREVLFALYDAYEDGKLRLQ